MVDIARFKLLVTLSLLCHRIILVNHNATTLVNSLNKSNCKANSCSRQVPTRSVGKRVQASDDWFGFTDLIG